MESNAHGTRGTDLFLLRNNILVHERIVGRLEQRLLKVAYSSEKLGRAHADLKLAQERLADLRSRLADSAREVMS